MLEWDGKSREHLASWLVPQSQVGSNQSISTMAEGILVNAMATNPDLRTVSLQFPNNVTRNTPELSEGSHRPSHPLLHMSSTGTAPSDGFSPLLNKTTIIFLVVGTNTIQGQRLQHTNIPERTPLSDSQRMESTYRYPSHCTTSSLVLMVPGTISAFKLSANLLTNWLPATSASL